MSKRLETLINRSGGSRNSALEREKLLADIDLLKAQAEHQRHLGSSWIQYVIAVVAAIATIVGAAFVLYPPIRDFAVAKSELAIVTSNIAEAKAELLVPQQKLLEKEKEELEEKTIELTRQKDDLGRQLESVVAKNKARQSKFEADLQKLKSVGQNQKGEIARLFEELSESIETERADKSLAKLASDLLPEPEMVDIKGGTFMMGSNDGAPDEKPVHEVTIQDFRLGKYEVIFEQYDHYARLKNKELPKDRGWGRGNRPVMNVSWDDAIAYAKWLSQRTGKTYRLPTEAEWEYACRSGGEQQTYCGGEDVDSLSWHNINSNSRTHEVGGKSANGLGIYDMSGNVWEWNEDCYSETYAGAPTNGAAWTGGNCDHRVVRGGSWSYIPGFLRSADRSWIVAGRRFSGLGFRLAQD